MEHAEKTLARLIEQRLKALNTNAFAVEKLHDLPPDAVRSVLRGEKKSGTGLNRAKQLCDALGLEFYIGPPRDSVGAERTTIDDTDFAQVPVYEAALAAGCGVFNQSEEMVGHLAFRRAWLHKIGVSVANAVLARAEGESMSPTIHDGDMMLIDRSRAELPKVPRGQKDKRPAPVYAILDEGVARVKRIEIVPGGTIALLSDNPSFVPEFRPAGSVSVIGRVVWWAHANME